MGKIVELVDKIVELEIENEYLEIRTTKITKTTRIAQNCKRIIILRTFLITR